MLPNNDPFADLYQKENQSVVNNDKSENDPFSDLYPVNNESSDKLPTFLKVGMSLTKPQLQSSKERLIGAGRGFTDIGEGLKQFYLEHFGKPGEAEKYTNEKQNERNMYNNTSAGKDFLANTAREAVNISPYFALGGPLAASGRNLITRMLAGGTGTGIIKGSQFVPEGQSRGRNAATGFVEGSALGALPELVQGLGKIIDKSKNIITAPFKNLKSLEEEAEKALSSKTSAKESERLLKEQGEREGLSTTKHPKLEADINKNQQKLDEINKHLETDLPRPEEYLLDTPFESQKRLLNSQLEHRKAEKLSKDIENQVGEHLESGSNHAMKGSKIIKQKLESNKKEISNEYDNLEKNYEDKNITIDNTDKVKKLNQSILELTQKVASESNEMQKLGNELLSLNKKEVIPAKDYVSAYRSVNGYVREANKKSYQPGINESERVIWKERANEAKKKLDEMDSVLKEGIGEEDYNQFKKTSGRWKNEVVPLYKSKLYHKIINDEPLPDNTVKALRAENKGTNIIKNVIKNDTQTLKHIIGQRYDTKVGRKKIYNPDEVHKEYLDLMPELSKLTKNKKEAEIIAENLKNKVSLHETFKNESEKLNKSYQKKFTNRKEFESNKKDLEKSIALMDKYIPELKKEAENTRATLKEHILAKNRLRRAEIKRQKARNKLKIGLGLLAAPVAGDYLYHKGVQAAKLLGGD